MCSSTDRRRPTAAHLTKRVGKYYVGRTIGEGTYAKVKYAQHMETGMAVAMKVLDKEHLVRTGMVAQIKREIAILRHLHHPNVVNLVEVMSSRDKIFMAMELVTGGDLFDKIAAEGPMKEPAAKALFAQLLGALGHCHEHGVFHRDLKPENVLLTSEGQAKLSDFGLGSVRQEDTVSASGLLNTTCGTPNYVAPEVLAKSGYDGAAADIWSLGVVLYVVLAGCLPFDEEDLVSLFHRISEAEYYVPPWLSAPAVSILEAMLQPQPDKRASLGALWSHPWMAGVIDTARSTGKVLPALSEDEGVPPDFADTGVRPQCLLQRVSVPRSMLESPTVSSRRLNAFELINDCFNISAIFEQGDDLVTRRTRFTSAADADVILAAIESAAVAVGGRVERKTSEFVKVYIPNTKGRMRVTAQVFELLPGKRIVDVAKASGNTVEFYKWYHELIGALGSLVLHKRQPIIPKRAGDGCETRQRHINAFELIGSCFNLEALFAADERSSRDHIQFSSRSPPGDILQALQEGTEALGGSVQLVGPKSAILLAGDGVAGSAQRSLRLVVRMFELMRGIHVVQIVKEQGAMLEVYRWYNRLAVRPPMRQVMMARKDGSAAHPAVSHASSLVSAAALQEAEGGSGGEGSGS